MRWLLENFAEWAFRNPMTAVILLVAINFAIWGAIIYIAAHFVLKYW